MLSLQLCFRIKVNLANCLQPNFPTFIHSSFPVLVVWGRHWKPHDYPNNSENFQERVLAEVCIDTWCDHKFFILFKGNRLTSVLQASSINSHIPVAVWVPSHWEHQPLPLSSQPKSEWLEGKSWYKLFFDEQVLSSRPSWNTQQDGASSKNFSEPSLCRGRVIGNKNTGSFRSWRGCCLEETFAAGQPWKQTTQLPHTLFRSPRSNCVNIF